MSFWLYPDARYYYRWYQDPADVTPTDGEIVVDRAA